MSNKINFNGELFPADQALFSADNRAFKYGDGLFETIRVFNGKMPFLDFHFERLSLGCSTLKLEIPDYFSAFFFKKEIEKLTLQKGNHRIRLTVFRSAGGFYTPTDHRSQFVIESEILKNAKFDLNPKGLKVGLFDEIKIAKNHFSNLKTCNSLPFILAGIFCKERGFDDCFILNDSGNIAESFNANVFLLKNKTILTPSLSEACVAGTMRKTIIEIAKSQDFKVKETTIQITGLKQADEIWLSNAIRGIRWIENFNDALFDHKIAKRFVNLLNKKITDYNL